LRFTGLLAAGEDEVVDGAVDAGAYRLGQERAGVTSIPLVDG